MTFLVFFLTQKAAFAPRISDARVQPASETTLELSSLFRADFYPVCQKAVSHILAVPRA